MTVVTLYTITTSIITKSLKIYFLAAILDLKEFANIINYCHSYENIISVTKVRSRALNLRLLRKFNISMLAILDCK